LRLIAAILVQLILKDTIWPATKPLASIKSARPSALLYKPINRANRSESIPGFHEERVLCASLIRLCIHPLKSFASVLESVKTMENTLYGVTFDRKDPEIKKVVELLLDLLGGQQIFVENSIKPLYHACACIASNYLLMNYHCFERYYFGRKN